MADDQVLLETIGKIYEAGVDPDAWPQALDALRRLTGSQIGVLHLSDRQHYMRQVVRGTNPALTVLANELHDHNPWMQRRDLAAPGQAVLGEQLFSPAELRRTLYYDEFIRKSDTFNLCALAFYNKADVFGGVSLYRGEQREPYGTRELALANKIAPHLQRAARIAGMLEGMSLYTAGLESAANHLAFEPRA